MGKDRALAAKVNRRLEVLRIAEAAGHALDLLNLAVEAFAHRVGHGMLIVGQNVVDVPPNRLRRLANRVQPTVCRPEVPPFPELPACRRVDVEPQTTQRLFDGPRPADLEFLAPQCGELISPSLRHVFPAVQPQVLAALERFVPQLH